MIDRWLAWVRDDPEASRVLGYRLRVAELMAAGLTEAAAWEQVAREHGAVERREPRREVVRDGTRS